MDILKTGNLAVRFLTEIFALLALGYWGFQVEKGLAVKIVLGIGAPLLAAVIWGTFGSPAAPYPLEGMMRLLLEFILLGSAVLALRFSGHSTLAFVFGFVVIINKLFMFAWGQ